MNQLPPDVLVKIIETLIYILFAIFSAGAGVFIFFHKSILKHLDKLANTVAELVTTLALLGQRSEDNFHKIEGLSQRIADLEKRMTTLESKTK